MNIKRSFKHKYTYWKQILNATFYDLCLLLRQHVSDTVLLLSSRRTKRNPNNIKERQSVDLVKSEQH